MSRPVSPADDLQRCPDSRHVPHASHLTRALRAATAAAAWCALALAAPAVQAGKAHEHGIAKLDVGVEGERITLVLDSPLDSLLGFERAPRTDPERKAAAELLAKLRQPAGLFKPTAAAQCALASADVKAPVLEPGAAKDSKDTRGGHADLEASYVFKCAQPAQLAEVQVDLFDAFKRMKRIDVQVAGPKGQAKAVLRAGSRTVKLDR